MHNLIFSGKYFGKREGVAAMSDVAMRCGRYTGLCSLIVEATPFGKGRHPESVLEDLD